MKLFKNAVFNLVGGLVPAVVALVTVPVILSRLGTSQYGVYALVTSIVGYFAVFDINVTAGSVKFLSEHHTRRDHVKAGQVLSFGALIYLVIGLLGALGLVVFAQPLVTRFFEVPPELHATSIEALHGAACGFLLGQMQVYLLSVPQALQRYDVAGRFEGIFGGLVSLLTLVVVLLGGGLPEIMWARAGLSAINCVLLVLAIRRIYPELRPRRPGRDVMGGIASFSAYSYLSRLATITFLHADNLILGAMVSMTAVSLFTVPFQLANRVFGIINRASAVLFPATSALAARGDLPTLRKTYMKATRYVVFLNACVLALLSVGARELLHYWVPTLDATASLILVLLALATFADTLTNIPSLVNDGLGTPRHSGLFAIVRAVFGLIAAYLGIRSAGILGAAVAQLIVSATMATVFVIWIHRVHRSALGTGVMGVLRQAWLPAAGLPLGLSLLALALPDRAALSPWLALGLFVGIGLACALWGAFVVLQPEDRAALLNGLARRRESRRTASTTP